MSVMQIVDGIFDGIFSWIIENPLQLLVRFVMLKCRRLHHWINDKGPDAKAPGPLFLFNYDRWSRVTCDPSPNSGTYAGAILRGRARRHLLAGAWHGMSVANLRYRHIWLGVKRLSHYNDCSTSTI